MKIHFIMQHKGGVGKSFVATIFAQYFLNNENSLACVDTDHNNNTFTHFNELNVKHINIVNEDNEIDPSKFDELIEYITESDKEHLIVDSGASNFLELNNYLLNNDVFSLLNEMGHNTYIHCVIVGGEGCQDTITCLKQLASHYKNSNVKIITWLNPFLGDITLNNKTFSEMKVFKENQDIITAFIEIPKFKNEFLADMKSVMADHSTLKTALENSKYRLMQKQRIKTMINKIKEAIDPVAPYFGA